MITITYNNIQEVQSHKRLREQGLALGPDPKASFHCAAHNV